MRENFFYAVVLGGYVNGYNIIRELHENGVENIILLDTENSLAKYSNKIKFAKKIDKSHNSLLEILKDFEKKKYYCILYPTDDLFIENIKEIYDHIKDFCFIPFNCENLNQSISKSIQYTFCQENNIPSPKFRNLENLKSLKHIHDLTFPVLIKPDKRDKLLDDFRNLYLKNLDDFYRNNDKIKKLLQSGHNLLATEVIPGDDSNIYAYVAYRSKNGNIYNDWIGKKLNQYPNNFGVFSSASNDAPNIIRKQGRKLVNKMNLTGICEPEFKYDHRDRQYKLMEINLRSMMWHRVGSLSGVKIHLTQYQDAIGQPVQRYSQVLDERIHFIYMKHELINLFFRKGYLKSFIYNVFGSKNKFFAVFDFKDIRPFLYDIFSIMKGVYLKCLKVLKID